MPDIKIDGKVFKVDAQKNLLEAVLSLGFDLPYFCWHPALGSVGSCRQCAVRKYRDSEDDQGQIVMSCMEPVAPDLRISLEEPGVSEFRKNVIEWLMVNHPHDCPVCDEGGECHLQDMTVMTGHAYRKYRFKKRTHRNQDLGPCINHEMNRCIQCYRCVRFYNDYAGASDLQVFAAHDHVYFGRQEEGTLESEFSGNLVEVCPTGVFTDKTLKEHYTRKWDLTSAPSVCQHCSLGCNVLAGERYGSLRRILSRYNPEVNGYFICDRGRFGYDFVNDDSRIQQAMSKDGSDWRQLDANEALQQLAGEIKDTSIMGIASPRASLESNFALRTLVGEENFYQGINQSENLLLQGALEFLRQGPLRTPSLKEIESHDAVIVIGEDVTNTAPMMDLALRQSVLVQPMKKIQEIGVPSWNDAAARGFIQDEKGPLFILTPQQTKLDDIATKCLRESPPGLANMVEAMARQLDGSAPGAQEPPEAEVQPVIQDMARILSQAERPLVISGTSLQSEALLNAAINLARALHKANPAAGVSFVFPECNQVGLGLMENKNLDQALAAEKDHQTLLIVETDLFRQQPAAKVKDFLKKFKKVVVLDHNQSQTTDSAHLVLPAGTFAEADGTLVNNEGRAQRFFQVQSAGNIVRESWRFISQLGGLMGNEQMQNWKVLDDVLYAIEGQLDQFKGISKAAPASLHRINGQKIPRSPHRYSGRTSMFADVQVNELRPPQDPDSPLSFTMEGYHGVPPASATSFYWSPGWNSAQAINKFKNEIEGPHQQKDPGVRLIEPPAESSGGYLPVVNQHHRKKGKWKLVPLHHIFGSEELSMKSSAIAARSPDPSLTMNHQEAGQLNITPGAEITLIQDKEEITLPVFTKENWPQGFIGISSSFPQVPAINTGAWVSLKDRSGT